MASGNSLDSIYNENSTTPIPIKIYADASQSVIMLYTKARFYRTAFNTNPIIIIPIGNNVIPTQWFSIDSFFSENLFNSTKPITEVSFPFNNSVQINYPMKFFHSIQIEYSLARDALGSGYQNFRKIQCIPVRSDGSTVYDANFITYRQPGPNLRDTMLIQGEINHDTGDVVRLRFNVVQDNTSGDQSATYMTIYSVTWNMSGLKTLS